MSEELNVKKSAKVWWQSVPTAKCQEHRKENDEQEPSMQYKDREDEIVGEELRNEPWNVSVFSKNALSTQ